MPPSRLVERSGVRSGFPVTKPVAKVSKNVGSLIPVPAEIRRRVPEASARHAAPVRQVAAAPNRSSSSALRPALSASASRAHENCAWMARFHQSYSELPALSPN